MSLVLISWSLTAISQKKFDVHLSTLAILFCIVLVFLQNYFQISTFNGVAWVSAAYLAGFLLSVTLGYISEANNQSKLLNYLFLSIAIASFLSIGLQLMQWLSVSGLYLFTLPGSSIRPHANLGQPNQLATLLLWGVLATTWGWQKKMLSSFTTFLVICFLLFGVALTGSRTALLGVLLLVCATWYWRNLWPSRFAPSASILLLFYFVLSLVFIAYSPSLFEFSTNTEASTSFLSSTSSISRLDAWKMFLDAIAQRPWFGYGWNQTALAHIEVAVNHPSLGVVFTFAHNLFLDLLIWCGIPLGLLFIFSIIYWIYKNLKAVNHPETAILMMMLLVIGNHAMLEMPLYYAYFLLPVGLVVGVINARHNAKILFTSGKNVIWGLWLVCAVLLAIIIKDYLEVEESYRYLRYEQMNIKVKSMGPPDVILLTQLHDQIDVARIEPHRNMAKEELKRIEDVVSLFPTPMLAHKLASTLALNQQPEKASLWLRRLCKIFPEHECKITEAIWARQSLKYPEIAAIPWPVK